MTHSPRTDWAESGLALPYSTGIGVLIFISASRVSVPPTSSRQPSHLAAAPLALLPLARSRPVANSFFAALALGLRGREQVVGRAARECLVGARARVGARVRARVYRVRVRIRLGSNPNPNPNPTPNPNPNSHPHPNPNQVSAWALRFGIGPLSQS